MSAYSVDLRKKALAAYGRGVSSAEVAEDLGVSSSWVRKMRLRLEAVGHLEPKRHPGNPPKIPVEVRGKLLLLAGRMSDATLPEICDVFFNETSIRVHPTTMLRTLRTLGLTRKKRPSGLPNESPKGSASYGGPSAGNARSGKRRG
jgi:transposase